MRTTLDWPENRKQNSPFAPTPGALTGGSGSGQFNAGVSPKHRAAAGLQQQPAAPFGESPRHLTPRAKVSLPTTSHSWWCVARGSQPP
jgi:hypothetical protein